MAITTQEQFNKLLKERMKSVITFLSNKIYDCVIEHIDSDVYNTAPNSYYARGDGVPTYEFRNAFQFDSIKESLNKISSTMFYEWQQMSKPSFSEPYIHGNFYEGKDRRSILADLLNVKGFDGQNDWGGKERNAFWDEALKEIDENFDMWAKESCNKYLK